MASVWTPPSLQSLSCRSPETDLVSEVSLTRSLCTRPLPWPDQRPHRNTVPVGPLCLQPYSPQTTVYTAAKEIFPKHWRDHVSLLLKRSHDFPVSSGENQTGSQPPLHNILIPPVRTRGLPPCVGPIPPSNLPQISPPTQSCPPQWPLPASVRQALHLTSSTGQACGLPECPGC